MLQLREGMMSLFLFHNRLGIRCFFFGMPIMMMACVDQKYSITERSMCDGQLQGEENGVVDSPFDKDGDGYFDAATPACQETYALEDLDCNDTDPAIYPGAVEIECNQIDDDCDDLTLDSSDVDQDGYDSCEDCADSDPNVNPGVTEITCNGLDDDCNEATLDAEDFDQDGYTVCEDCNDFNPAINPGIVEIECNFTDDDCNPDTVDDPDLDSDGFSQCVDCDDQDSLSYPGADEICDDGIDQNCNGEIDEDCEVETGFSGIWVLTPAPSYSCAYGLVSINFATANVFEASPVITIGANGSQPGTMSGNIDSNLNFSVTNTLSGSCTEVFSMSGQFIDSNTFTATFTSSFSGAFCFDCTTQSWQITGVR